MPKSYRKYGDVVSINDLPLSLQTQLTVAPPGSLIAGLDPERQTLEVYRVVQNGSAGSADFIGYLSPEPHIVKGT